MFLCFIIVFLMTAEILKTEVEALGIWGIVTSPEQNCLF